MTDKILTEAFDKMKAIEEDNGQGGEAVEELRDIQDNLNELIDRLDMVIRETLPHKHSNLEAYLLAPLKIRAGTGEYMSNDPSIEKVIEMVIAEHGEGDEYDMDESAEPEKKDANPYGALRTKLDQIKARQGQRGYDDRSTRTPPFAKRRS